MDQEAAELYRLVARRAAAGGPQRPKALLASLINVALEEANNKKTNRD